MQVSGSRQQFANSGSWHVMRTAAGMLAVAAMLLLSVPGVRVVHASDSFDQSSLDPNATGQTCEASSSPDPATQVARALDQMLAAIPTQPDENRDDTIVLNNRGYNYASGGPFDQAVLEQLRGSR